MARVRHFHPVAAGLAVGLALATGGAASPDPAAAMLGRPAPSFRLTDVSSGRTVSLGDMRGRIVVLHFGASW